MSSSPETTADNDVEWVSEDIIRREFERLRIRERTTSHELRRIILDYNTHLTSKKRLEKNGSPATRVRFTPCTRSQMVGFFSGNRLVATVHRYIRRDSILAGSGKEDPKAIFFEDGRILRAQQAP